MHPPDHRARRFIPTRMGNTRAERLRVQDISVHPHTHGEHPVDVDSEFARAGSSPHAWGTRYLVFVNEFPCRFIPTRMGNTR